VDDASLQNTPLHEEHRRLRARIVPFAGYRMPVQYEGVVEEHDAVRGAAGLFDVSHMGELFLRGEHAIAVANELVTNNVKRLVDGKAIYTVACKEDGGILDDLIVYRKGAEVIMIVCNAANREKMASHFSDAAKGRCTFEDASDDTALIALQGPKSFEILAEAGVDAALTALEPFHLADGEVAGHPATVARTGYTGEDGVELFCHAQAAAPLWRALLEAGEAHGLKPAGLGARDTLRLEACLCLYGNDIDETTNPYEARLGWVVKLKKGEFRGREALRAVRQQGVERRLVGLEMTGRGIARHGYPILDRDGERVGEVTSGSPDPTVGKNVGLGYVPVSLAEEGTPLGIEIRGKVIDAVVVKTPFYKRNK